MSNRLLMSVAFSSFAFVSSVAFATLPDNGSGTVDMPLAAPYVSAPPDVMQILNGLPPGTTIDIVPVLASATAQSESPGGTLGGTHATGLSSFDWDMDGTGSLAGFSRSVSIPLQLGVDTAPRSPGTPVQSFDCDMMQLQGQLPPGDPDFDLLRVTGGTSFGLPSPGHTTLLTAGPGQWNVDSFFDITYRIDFVGHPGGPLSGRSGSTTGTIRMFVPEPASLSALAGVGLIALRRRHA